MDYAVNACPNTSECGGDRNMMFNKLSDPVESRTVDFADTYSCGFMSVATCGLPTVKISSVVGVTADDVELTVMEYSMTSAIANGLISKNVSALTSFVAFPNGYQDFYVATTFNDFTAMTLTDGEAKSIGTYATSATLQATNEAAIAKYKVDYTKYIADSNKYLAGFIDYQNSYNDMLVEQWTDFIGTPREEGKELDKAILADFPKAPKAPVLDVGITDPKASDFVCGGNPCSATIPVVAGNKKSFGVYGLGDDDDMGFDFNEESIMYHLA